MRGIALLSGGLDSVVSMLKAKTVMDIILAITVDYGQRAKEKEIASSRNLCKKLGISHKVIKLEFMQEIESGLNETSQINDITPWVPNRNGLFINLAAAYAEYLKADYILCGFNREEAIDFPDNSAEFVTAANQSLFYSTLNHVELKSFVIDLDKVQIIKEALKMGIDLNNTWSCYRNTEYPCGVCPSCKRNIAAFKKAGLNYEDYIHTGKNQI